MRETALRLAGILACLASMPTAVSAKSFPCGVLRSTQGVEWLTTVRAVDARTELTRSGERPDWSTVARVVISTCVRESCSERAIIPPSRDFALGIVDGGLVIQIADMPELLPSSGEWLPAVTVALGKPWKEPLIAKSGSYLRFSRESCVIPPPFVVIPAGGAEN